MHELIIDMIHAKEIDLIALVRGETESNWSIISDREEFSELFTQELLEFEVGNQWVLLKQINKDWLQYGPFTDLQVEVMIKHGKIKYSDWIWKTGFKRWYQVYSLSEFTSKKDQKAKKTRSTLDEKKVLSEVFLMESPDIVNEYGVQNISLVKPPEDLTKQDLKEHLIKRVVQPQHRSGNTLSTSKSEKPLKKEKPYLKLNTFKDGPKPVVRGSAPSYRRFLILAVCALFLAVVGMQWVSIKYKQSMGLKKQAGQLTQQASFLVLETKNLDKESASLNITSDIPVQLELRSVPGYNLNTKSFFYEKSLEETSFILLNNLNLKPGQYWLKVAAGNNVKTQTFFLGQPTASYLADLWSHNKKMSAYHQNEKEILYDDIALMEASLIELVKHFNQEDEGDFKLTVTQGWRPSLVSALSKPLLNWKSERGSQYVHPGLWMINNKAYKDLLALSQKFDSSDVSELLDRLVKMRSKINSLVIGAAE